MSHADRTQVRMGESADKGLTMWIQLNECERAAELHEIKRDDNREWQVYHSDGSICEVAECNVRELTEAA